jgi:hypothetical protein
MVRNNKRQKIEEAKEGNGTGDNKAGGLVVDQR